MDQKIEAPTTLYLEDLSVHQRFTSGLYHMEEDRMKAFAAEFDPQPFHLDEAAAQRSVFHGLAASGWHTAAVTMRLLVGSLPFASGMIGLGGEIAWPKPTRPGDELHVESEILEIVASRSKPNQAVVSTEVRRAPRPDPIGAFSVKVVPAHQRKISFRSFRKLLKVE